jgi:hypothetical protein
VIGKFLFFLEGDPINFGLSFGKVRQLLLDGILLLQEIVFLLQVRYPLLKKGDLLVFEWGASSSIRSKPCAPLPGKHNKGVSPFLESLSQIIETNKRRKVRSNS